MPGSPRLTVHAAQSLPDDAASGGDDGSGELCLSYDAPDPGSSRSVAGAGMRRHE